jgi:hypothetical protein
MAEPRVVYPRPQKDTSGSGGQSNDFFLQLVDIKVAASEDRVMRHLTEKTTTVETQLSKQILDVEAKLSAQTATIITRLDQSKPAPTLFQISSIVGAAFLGSFAILAFASDRFDGGLAASAIKDQIALDQVKRDAAQDAKLDQIINAVQGLSAGKKLEP